ncbi:M1 family aminopeptidase [Parabacteroides sp. PF5-6]|uniref:M1 family metallopeptidase n=1 Tax=Parabacteroides sp. PF5-6 TaxID=1742403 RepID=UPI00240588A0|nr:M1 family aminopeptidase [Parabacteroides sp. PF5-6]MDF9828800.1 aminopeptidase N [Parabacteroides sp. PF5-6]
MKNTSLCLGICVLVSFFSCRPAAYDDRALYEAGVSETLAQFRKANYQDVHYELAFHLPESRHEAVMGEVILSFDLSEEQPVIIDFRADSGQIKSLTVNNQTVSYTFAQEHIVIDRNALRKGPNAVFLTFEASDQSLNRRDDYLYTLLVPDRARTLFPCFDQPDLKATYSLRLITPAGWEAVANSPTLNVIEDRATNERFYSFATSEPLSTYLFSFVAGRLRQEQFSRGDRRISIYHRETDPLKVAQCPAIAEEVFEALEWMEKYTAVPYPFAKYDVIILPGFQYGGMEHTGATLYNDRRMFLNAQPTLNERLSRSTLIAHETAHMWFGDYVTMQWFDDVWTKEIFANYFASRIVEPLFPEINHRLNFLCDYFPSAYSEDRTAGTNPIKQPLDNLSNAGLVYGQIIYNKSPIVLDMLVRKIGEEAFRKGIQTYLTTYAYGNARWEDLIAIWDALTTDDLDAWSRYWVHEKGMPVIDSPGDTIPNADGRGYGFYRLTPEQSNACFQRLHTSTDEVEKGAVLIILYENLMNQTVDPLRFRDELLTYIAHEPNSLLYALAIGYLANAQYYYHLPSAPAEQALWTIATTHANPAHRLQALRTYRTVADTPQAIARLYAIWENQQPPQGCALSENDYITLAYTLAIRLPERAEAIGATQRQRISNPDRLAAFDFAYPSVSPHRAVRDSVFASLLQAENRRIEPWASTALAHLNHTLRQEEAVGYIRPALEALTEVQRTGDIFFPTHWLRALLAGHLSAEAREEVEQFFAHHPAYHPMLTCKIRQQSDHLYRFIP